MKSQVWTRVNWRSIIRFNALLYCLFFSIGYYFCGYMFMLYVWQTLEVILIISDFLEILKRMLQNFKKVVDKSLMSIVATSATLYGVTRNEDFQYLFFYYLIKFGVWHYLAIIKNICVDCFGIHLLRWWYQHNFYDGSKVNATRKSDNRRSIIKNRRCKQYQIDDNIIVPFIFGTTFAEKPFFYLFKI